MSVTETSIYFCLVHKETGKQVNYDLVMEEFGEDQYKLTTVEGLPVWKCDTYEHALRVLYEPHCRWYSSYYESPSHMFNAEDYKIVKCEATTNTTIRQSGTKEHDLSVAKDLYNVIMVWKYGKGGTYENDHRLQEKLNDNSGKIDHYDLEEYLNYKEK